MRLLDGERLRRRQYTLTPRPGPNTEQPPMRTPVTSPARNAATLRLWKPQILLLMRFSPFA